MKSKYESAIDEISKSGGNVIRVWVHIDGQHSPKFDSNGFATGADTQSLIKEIGELLDHAASKNVFVILCLWNLAVKPQQMIHLYSPENQKKLDSYLDKVLKPMAMAFKDKPALGGYDIINEPQGSFSQGVADSNPCYDTMNLKGTGTDWTGSHLHIKDVQRFVNHHIDAIKSVAPGSLVTVGDSADTSTNVCDKCRNYYSDHCLEAAGGKPRGVLGKSTLELIYHAYFTILSFLDFYQLHSYTWQGKFADTSPFKKHNSDYKSDKPIIVGEFATSCSESKNAANNYKYIYESGYEGALSWQYNEGGDCADKRGQADEGMAAIKDMSSNGKIRIKL